MGLILVDGFEHYGPVGTSGGTLENRLGQRLTRPNIGYSPSAKIDNGRGGGLAFNHVNYIGKTLEHYIGIRSELIFGFAIFPVGSGEFIQFRSNFTTHVSIYMSSSTHLYIAGPSGILFIYETGLHWYRWSYIEIKLKIHDTTGSVEMHVNGEQVYNQTNIDTRNGASASVNNINFKFPGGAWRMDDMYIIDPNTAGLSTFLGPIAIETLSPNGDDTSDWTPDSGTTNYTQVDNLYPEDSDYVYSSTITDLDLYDYENLVDIDTVKAVQIVTAACVDGGDVEKIAAVCESNVTTAEQTEQSIFDNNREQHTIILEDDPDTSTAWTVSGVNAAKFGVKHK